MYEYKHIRPLVSGQKRAQYNSFGMKYTALFSLIGAKRKYFTFIETRRCGKIVIAVLKCVTHLWFCLLESSFANARVVQIKKKET